MSALLTQNPQMFVKCIEGKVHHTVSHRTELLLSPLAAAFKSIKMEAYTAKHPEAYAAMEDQIETLGYDDAVNTFRYCVENMYPTGPDKKEDFNEVCDTCDYCDARLLYGWDAADVHLVCLRRPYHVNLSVFVVWHLICRYMSLFL